MCQQTSEDIKPHNSNSHAPPFLPLVWSEQPGHCTCHPHPPPPQLVWNEQPGHCTCHPHPPHNWCEVNNLAIVPATPHPHNWCEVNNLAIVPATPTHPTTGVKWTTWPLYLPPPPPQLMWSEQPGHCTCHPPCTPQLVWSEQPGHCTCLHSAEWTKFLQSTKYFIHPTTGNYSVNLCIKSI